eukprot:2151830-Pleurochrysis_carterae.AAC.1
MAALDLEARHAAYQMEIRAAAVIIAEIIRLKGCGPILVRLAWHDAGTYDVKTKTGGPHAAMRFEPEASYAADAGLNIARDLLEPVHAALPGLSYADIWQASCSSSD